MTFLDKTGLRVLLIQIKSIFGPKSVLDSCAETRQKYLLEIDYEKEFAFDIKEIITGENDDITLEENESLLLTTSDEILVYINDEYVIIEKGE